MNRRDFIKASSVTGLAATVHPIGIIPRIPKVYRTALIGSGWWGMNILRTALAGGQSQAIALCDVDQRHLEAAATEVETLTGSRPNTYADYRALLAREKPDIVIVATPDHWHALPMIAAVEAGAHVYVEKPVIG